MKRKILLYGDLSLNIVDGSSVWLISLAKLLAQDTDNVIDILLKEKIKNNVLIKSIQGYSNITLLNPDEYIPKYKNVELSHVSRLVEVIDEYRDYSCIIVRGFNAVKNLITNRKLANKLIPYLTDFCHEKNNISKKEVNELKTIYEIVNQFFVQTEQMKEYLKEIIEVDGSKFKILSPIIFKENISKKIIPKSIVYAGKIALDWNILELIEIMERLYKKDKDIKLYFIGDKFNKDLMDKKEEILQKLNNMPNVIFYGSLPKKETTQIINSSELGYSFRSSKVDNNNSLEVSSKVLEYCFCNVPVLLKRTKSHESILGKDYPLYVENVDECVNKILDFFNNKEKYKTLNNKISENVKKYLPEEVYKNVLTAIDKYEKKKLRLLITGHDLKFIKDLYPYFENEYELNIQNYEEYESMNIEESKKLLRKTDIVWCEWMLFNARWYSIHKFPHQKLFIRAHRFELAKKYGKQINWTRVNKLITVSYYYMEQFIEQFNVPREKVIVVNNFIDSKKYTTIKEEGYKYNLAMIGILPKRKGFDRAIDLLIELKRKNPKYKLYIAGKRPEEFPNTKNIEEEKNYYEKVEEKIKQNKLEEDVIFTGWIEVPKFLEKIGYTLSLSDKKFPESFHVSPFECMVSKGIGMLLDWEGIEYIYPDFSIYNSVKEIAEKIEEYNNNDELYNEIANKGRNFTINNYDLPIIWNTIEKVINS